MSQLKIRGLDLVAHGACKEGKRLFLKEAGVSSADRLGDAELDCVLVGVDLRLPSKPDEPVDWADVWLRAIRSGYLGWLMSRGFWLAGKAELPEAVLTQVAALLTEEAE